MTYVTTFQLDLSFLTKDLKPLFGVNSSPLDELKMIVLLCCPSAFSAVASCEDWEQNCDTWANSNFKGFWLTGPQLKTKWPSPLRRQSGQKLQCLYGNPTANNFFQNWILHNYWITMLIKIPGRRLHSPSLKDVAWLEDVQLIFHTFVCKFGRVDKHVDAVCGEKNVQTNVWKI